MENPELDKKYDDLNLVELEKRLKRDPKTHEVINSDYDSDLVTEILWQIIKELDARVKVLEEQILKDKPL